MTKHHLHGVERNPTPAKSLSASEPIIRAKPPQHHSTRAHDVQGRFCGRRRRSFATGARSSRYSAPAMTVPSYKAFIQPILLYLAQQDAPVAVADACEAAARELGLTAEARGAQLASGGPVYRNRAAWAINWLKRAGLVEAEGLGAWRLTVAGRGCAATPISERELLSRFSSRVEVRPSRTKVRRSRVTSNVGSALSTRGTRKAYRLPPRPLAVGGQAEVYRAIRKSDDAVLVLKRSRNKFGPNRMRREIEIQSALQHPNIMPILDWDRLHHSWYVMPLGTRTMADLGRPIEDTLLHRIVAAVLAALEFAHSAGHPHRDVKPQNVIELDDGLQGARWVLADWGLTRRAPGNTTAEWTETGQLLGSAGFAPPEAYLDAHNVGAPGDVYALGQLIAWALGVDPVPNMSPAVVGPWRPAVDLMTVQDARRRAQTVAEVRSLLPALTG